MPNHDRGFTLIELIVVIAIVAVLVTIVILAINPAEQLARSRDTKRVSDLDTIRSAWNLYMGQATGTPDLSGDITANNRCDNGAGSDSYFVNTADAPSIPTGFDVVVTSTAQGLCPTAGTQCANTTSWAPAEIGGTPGGSPISNLPLDPTGKGGGTSLYYSYACDFNDKTYEFNAILESTYFKADIDADGTDGGSTSTAFEVGNKLTIIP